MNKDFLSFVRGLCDVVEALFMFAGVILFICMICAVSLEIVMRYAFNSPTFWAEPLARNAMVCMVLLGLAVGIRKKENICVDFIADTVPGTLRPILAWTRFLSVLAFAGVLLFYGWQMAWVNMGQTITGLDVPKGWIQMVVPVAAFGMILFTIELIVKRDWSRF